MEKRSDALPLWLKIVLAILPGILAASVEICQRQIPNVAYPYLVAPLFFCSLFLCIAGFIYERQLAVWSFPALGLLLAWMAIGVWKSPLMLTIWLGIVAVLVARWLWSFKYWEVSLLGLLLIGSVVLLVLVFPLFEVVEKIRTPYQEFLDLLALPISALSMLSILPGIVGLFVARRAGVRAALIFVGSACVMWEMVGDPDYALLLWTDDAMLEMFVALHPALFFLILVPIASLLVRSTKAHFASFLLPIAVGLVSAAAIASAIRPYATYATFAHSVAMDATSTLIPLTIFMIFYAKRHNVDKNQAFPLVSAYR